MNIQTVRDNLKVTIAGKERLLERSMERLRSHYKDRMDSDTWFSIKTTVDFLEVNIKELRSILADVEQCIPLGPEFSFSDDEEASKHIKTGR